MTRLRIKLQTGRGEVIENERTSKICRLSFCSVLFAANACCLWSIYGQ